MTMRKTSAAAAGCLKFVSAARRVTLVSSLTFVAMLPQAQAATYVGGGIAAFDAAAEFDDSADGFEFFAGFDLRPKLAIEAGVIDQRGRSDYYFYPDDYSRDLTEYRWRALHVGPRFVLPVGERFQVRAGVSLAHVSFERERAGPIVEGGEIVGFESQGEYHGSGWGALASLGVAYDITPQQRLSLDFRRLHAPLRERCEQIGDSGPFDCSFVEYQSTDGLSLAWSYRFD
jgi:hypothetical protein